MMGSGKTAVGRLLAEATGWQYADNDDLLETGDRLTARDLSAGGEAALRASESEALMAGLAMPEPCIVGAAAGTILDAGNRAAIAAAGVLVLLRARPETLAVRVLGANHRPWLESDPLAWLQQAAAVRVALYASIAEVTVDVDELEPAEVVRRILSELTARDLLPVK
jgi:shikimate kinase